jgi:hypothetical protein
LIKLESDLGNIKKAKYWPLNINIIGILGDQKLQIFNLNKTTLKAEL